MSRGSSMVEVTWHKVFPRDEALRFIHENFYGKYLVICSPLYGLFKEHFVFCVVDDFGNLVAVPA